MILISHRGNTTGPDPENENKIKYLMEAISSGYQVETDVWVKGGTFYLGHDMPQYVVDKDFLLRSELWCHAKNLDALCYLLKLGAHCFWHQDDDFTLTSGGYIWTYANKELCSKSICVLPEVAHYSNKDILISSGICSDIVAVMEKTLNTKTLIL